METVIAALHHWLAKRNIRPDGVSLVIELESERIRHHAIDCLKADLKPHVGTLTGIDGLEIMGTPVQFRTRP
jgi:hypothetical protein